MKIYTYDLKTIASYHSMWIKFVHEFGSPEPEDVVQRMYLKISPIIDSGRKFNAGYIYMTLRNIMRNDYRKNQKEINQKNDILEEYKNIPDDTFFKSNYEYDFSDFTKRVRDILEEHHFFFERMYYLYTDVPTSTQRKLAKKLGLSLTVVNQALKKVKQIIEANKDELQNEYNKIQQK